MIRIRRVVGTSMAPGLRPGRIVLATKLKQPQVGDIVIAKKADIEIIKRVAQTSDKGYYLLGDNPAASTDSRSLGWFAPSQVFGVVIGRIG